MACYLRFQILKILEDCICTNGISASRHFLPCSMTVIRFGGKEFQLWRTASGWVDSITYSEAGRIIKEMTAVIMRLGIQRQDRVALMSFNQPQWLWADFSIQNAGAVTVTVYPTLSEKELVFIINDSESRMLYIQDEIMLQKALAEWDQMPTLEKIIVMADDYQGHHPNVLSLNQLRSIGVRHLVQYPLDYERRWRSVDLHDLMTIIYTSGTTDARRGYALAFQY